MALWIRCLSAINSNNKKRKNHRMLPIDWGTSWDLALCGAVKLLGHQFAVPAEDRIRLDDGGNFLQGLLSQLLANLREGLPFGIRQPHASPERLAEYPVFCHEILMAQQRGLIDGSCDVRQQCLPTTNPGSTSSCTGWLNPVALLQSLILSEF